MPSGGSPKRAARPAAGSSCCWPTASLRAARPGWREGEADALADRIAELVEGGGIRPGQIVLLLEAGTDAGLYEDALRRRGLPTVRATGRGYYGQQEVGDLLTYLRLLRTRTDDCGAARRAGLAAGRRLERRPGADPAGDAAARGDSACSSAASCRRR